MLYFSSESGRRSSVPWDLKSISGCEVDGEFLIVPNSSRTARFKGTTNPVNHPVSAYDSAIEIALSSVVKE